MSIKRLADTTHHHDHVKSLTHAAASRRNHDAMEWVASPSGRTSIAGLSLSPPLQNSPCARCTSLNKDCVYNGNAAHAAHTVGSRNSSRSVSVSNTSALDSTLQQGDNSLMEYMANDEDQSGMLIDGQDRKIDELPSVQVPQEDQFARPFSLPNVANSDKKLDNGMNNRFGSITPTAPLRSFGGPLQISHDAGANGSGSQIFSTQALLAGFDFNGLLYGHNLQGESPASLPASEPSATTFDFNAVLPGNDDYLASFLQSAQHISPSAPTPGLKFGNIWPDTGNWANEPAEQPAVNEQAPGNNNQLQQFITANVQSRAPDQKQSVGSTHNRSNSNPSAITPSATSSGQQDLHATDALLSLAQDLRTEGESPNHRPVPPINHGLRTRAPSPVLPSESSEWPTAWDARQGQQERPDDVDVGEGEHCLLPDPNSANAEHSFSVVMDQTDSKSWIVPFASIR